MEMASVKSYSIRTLVQNHSFNSHFSEFAFTVNLAPEVFLTFSQTNLSRFAVRRRRRRFAVRLRKRKENLWGQGNLP